MIFESLWPLFFVAAVPVIIILYLLKPKGEDYEISSNLLWQKLLKNQQSKTFFEKFVHNILMYLQILIIILLVVALMAPFVKMEGKGGGRKILLIDTSASMQHKNNSGKSRLEEAVKLACDYVQNVENTAFSLVTADAAGVHLLAVDSKDEEGLLRLIQAIDCSDGGTGLTGAQNVLDNLQGENQEDLADLIVFTDGSGAADFESLRIGAGKELYVVGETAWNLANEYTVFSKREDGLYDVIVSVTNYGDKEAACDVGLYENEEQLLDVKSLKLSPSETKTCLFEGVIWEGDNLHTELSGISFAGGGKDSLKRDNVSYAVKTKNNLIQGLLVGDGNVFLEKAYQAVTGKNLAKGTIDISATEDYNVVIYDGNQYQEPIGKSRLIFGNAFDSSTEKLQHVVLNMRDCELTAGLSDFSVGVNQAYCFELPEDAKSFLEYEGKTIGYYRDLEGYREIVVGFDIRESDFPLRAEFPIFLANTLLYLSDTSWLATNIYYAGEELALQPWAQPDVGFVSGNLTKSGCYEIGNAEYKEAYVVRFQTATESDGRKVAESKGGDTDLQVLRVKHTLRNLFILAALLLLILEWILYVRQMRYKGKFYLFLRSVVMLVVILALAGIKVPIGSNKSVTIFLVDTSKSNEAHMEEIENYISAAVEQMPGGNEYGIVVFGKNAKVEQFVTVEKQYSGLLTVTDKSATNFEEAVSKGLALIPEGAKGRLVFLTDGKETKGDMGRMVAAVRESEVELLALLYEEEKQQDAYIENVTMPAYLHPGDKYTVNVVVESSYDTDAVIHLYRGSNQVGENHVHLNKGSNLFAFSLELPEDMDGKNMENLVVRVNAPGDGCEENNSYNAFSVVEALPRALVISDRDTDITGFAGVLQAAGCDYSVISAFNAPETIEDMLQYKVIFLVDTYIDDLPYGFLQNLESYVKDYGCGFVCCGGEDSFALGGYRDTVIETVLPVNMELRGMNEAPAMAMVMVIDHSGSMTGDISGHGSNLDVAIKAATVAVDNLKDKDYVGVLTFDDGYDWQVKLTSADKKAEIKEEIKKIEAGGGTTIKPALHEAFREISQSSASVKHVILLTDGMGETTDYGDVMEEYAESGITLSTVAVGKDSDRKLLERLATECGGRYYYSDLSSDIPKIFAQEVFLGGDSFIKNGEFALSVRSGHELTRSLFTEGWPYLYGYIASSPKGASSSIITTTQKGDPILTTWQYGLGRTVAWNSDVTGEWSGSFADKEDYVQLWKRIVDYSAGNADIGEDKVNVVTTTEVTEVIYETVNYSNQTEIITTVMDPLGETGEVKLFAVAPGKYKAEIPTENSGMYHFNIRREEDGEIHAYMTTAAVVQFSDEYKFDADEQAFIRFTEQCGKIIKESDYLWKKLETKTKRNRSIVDLLLCMGILFFLVDVAMRRFQYIPKWKNKPVKDLQTKNPAEMNKNNISEMEETKEEKKEVSKRSKKGKEKTISQPGLDTSALLKKKDDRNI